MGLTTAMQTALTGMQAAETTIDVTGNNLANSQTVGFKESEAIFATQLLQTQSLGSGPTEGNGGTNPRQIGLGTRTAEISPKFTQGTIEISSSPSDLAIQGDGFFIVEDSEGEQLYTRNGVFKTNADNELVAVTGERAPGLWRERRFRHSGIIAGADHDSAGDGDGCATRPRTSICRASSRRRAMWPTRPESNRRRRSRARAAAALTAATLLVDVVDTTQGPTPIFQTGSLEFTAHKGGRALAPQTMQITATSTVQDLMTFMQQAIGIQTTADDPGIPTSLNNIPTESGTLAPGITITNGQIRVVSNNGGANAVDIGASSFRLTPTTGSLLIAESGIRFAPGCRRRRHRRRFPGLRFAGHSRQRADYGRAGIGG